MGRFEEALAAAAEQSLSRYQRMAESDPIGAAPGLAMMARVMNAVEGPTLDR